MEQGQNNDNQRYFNFPVSLLQGFQKAPEKSLTNIRDYAIYAHMQLLELGTDLEKHIEASYFYRIRLDDNRNSLKNGQLLYDSIPYDYPKVGINVSVWFDYRFNLKEEFEKACLLAYLAIKSIVQNKTYCKIDNRFLLARMDGKSHSISHFNELSPEVKQYANEYQTKKLKTALRINWGLITYSRYTRGFYVSFSITLEELVFQAEKRRKSTKEKQLKEQEREALKTALLRLNNERP
jgi:hypothetical protein